MGSIKDHYEKLLAANYIWAFGGHEENAEKFKAFLSRFDIKPRQGTCVLDLGCGPGYQTLALADMGFEVVAMDLSPTLLEELRSRIGGRGIEVIEDDMLNFQQHCAGREVALVLCLGDVLSHLQSAADMHTLFGRIFETLSPGGGLLLSYRDQTIARTGTDRIIPFYSDETKIMTTFVEFEEDILNVTDVFHARTGSDWTIEKSEYTKLRLRTEHIETSLNDTGFEIAHNEIAGGHTNILAMKNGQ